MAEKRGMSGWALFIVGAAVGGFSYYIDLKQGHNKLVLFIIAGALFMLIGLARGLVWLLARAAGKTGTEKGTAASRTQASDVTRKASYNNLQPGHHGTQGVFFCRHCGKQVTHNGNYCIFCGGRIR